MSKTFLRICAILLLCMTFCACGAESSVPETTVNATQPAASSTAEPTTEPTTQPTTVPTEPPRPWKDNLMIANNPWDQPTPFFDNTVLGSRYTRGQITTVTFLDTLADVPENAWDVSEAQDGRVMAWIDTSGGFDLYIAGEGGVLAPQDCGGFFWGFDSLKEIHWNDAFHTEEVIWMEAMFSCKKLKTLDVSSFNLSSTTDLTAFVSHCAKLESLITTGWDTSNVEEMDGMFSNCNALKELDLSHWDVSNVTNMSQMFVCYNLERLNISGWDTSSVTDMSGMFSNWKKEVSVDLSGLNTANVTTMEGMFSWSSGIKALDLSHFDTSKVTNMKDMFQGCDRLKELELGQWETNAVEEYNNFLKSSTYKGEPWRNLFVKAQS